MNKLILPIILSLLLVALVSAIASITYTTQYVILEDNGNLNITSEGVPVFSVLGYVCQSANCTTVSSPLFAGQPLSSSTDSIVLDFPTSLASTFGYGIYFYKPGYIPGEVSANWAGSGSTNAVAYLAKQRNCLAQVNITDLSSSSSINFTASMNSPINHAGLLDYVPSEIQDQYTVDASINYQVVGEGMNFSNTVPLVLPYSGSGSIQVSVPVTPGNYTVYLSGTLTDSVCLNSIPGFKTMNVSVSGNGTNETNLPPSTVSNLHATTITSSKITWVWNNPTDQDFSNTVIYLDGVNVANSTGTSYTAQGLAPNSTHTIKIHTVDTAGNINNTDVSNTATTLSNDNNNGGNGGKNKKNGKTTFVSDLDLDNSSAIYSQEDAISLGTPVKKSNWMLWLIVAILLILIIILAVLIVKLS